MKNTILFISLFISSIIWSQSFNGFTLYNQSNQNTTYLIDKDGNTTKTWNCNVGCNYTVLLKEDGNIVRGGKYNSNQLNGAAVGGMVQEYDANSNLVWEFVYSNANHVSHHDIALNPTNNSVFLIAWEVISVADLTQAGYANASSEKWAPHIVEVQPDGTGGGQIIWEWHIIQDFDNTKSNFGVIADHPELIDINQIPASGGGGGGPGGNNGDWFHVNGIDYNSTLDQIVFSSRKASEIYIIDHSTTTTEAASHIGGNSGQGGDIMYRWGNPANYGAPGNQTISEAVHDPRWIKDGRPFAGQIQVFNNSGNNGSSAVDIIDPPVSGNGYSITPGSAYAPASFGQRHNCLANSTGQSASDRMSNGNIFVAVSQEYMYEVDVNGNVVWQYNAGPQKAFRYECDHMGIQALLGNPCGLGVEEENDLAISVYPNPTNGEIIIEGALLDNLSVEVLDMQGNSLYIANATNKIDLANFANGIYILKIKNKEDVFTVKQISLNK